MRKKVLFSIVNYGTPDMVIDSLKKLEEERLQYPDFFVHIVDNRSPDDSVTKLTEAIEQHNWSEWVRLIRSPVNGGFAYGNNLAIKEAEKHGVPFDYVWLLNPDSYVSTGAVRKMVYFMDHSPQVAIGGTRILNEDGTHFGSAFRFPSIASEFIDRAAIGPLSRFFSSSTVAPYPPVNTFSETEWVSGASMVIRKIVFDTIGLMDEGYFLYFEEVDFCLKAKKNGYKIYYTPDVEIVHMSGKSTGLTGKDHQLKRIPNYWFDSRRRFFEKNFGVSYLISANIFLIFGHGLYKTKNLFLRRNEKTAPKFISDFIHHSIFGTTNEK